MNAPCTYTCASTTTKNRQSRRDQFVWKNIRSMWRHSVSFVMMSNLKRYLYFESVSEIRSIWWLKVSLVMMSTIWWCHYFDDVTILNESVNVFLHSIKPHTGSDLLTTHFHSKISLLHITEKYFSTKSPCPTPELVRKLLHPQPRLLQLKRSSISRPRLVLLLLLLLLAKRLPLVKATLNLLLKVPLGKLLMCM